MLRLVQRIGNEETDRQKILAECDNEDEKLKLRQKFIEKKAENQKEVKKLMALHKKEAENMDKQELNAKLKETQMAEKSGDDEIANDEEEQENEDGEEENIGDGEEEG